MLRPVLAGSLVAAALLVAVPAAALLEPAKTPAPPTDDGFALEDYVRDVFKGKLFVGGKPAVVVGAKTKDKATIVGGKAHFQPQVALRRVGRDDGSGRFLVLKSRSWGSALAYVIKLNRGIVRFFQLAFPKAIGGTTFPTAYASLTYTFEVAADSETPKFAAVGAASAPHPDRALARTGVRLVTLKQGFTPGNYIVRITTEADCCFDAKGHPHPSWRGHLPRVVQHLVQPVEAHRHDRNAKPGRDHPDAGAKSIDPAVVGAAPLGEDQDRKSRTL